MASSDASMSVPTPDVSTDDDAGICDGWCTGKGGTNVDVDDNHLEDGLHSLVITAEHVRACEDHLYDMRGEADHTHEVLVTAEDFRSIDKGGQLNLVTTESNGHTHAVWSDCE